MTDHSPKRRSRVLRNLNTKVASVPMILAAVVVFVGGTVWTIVYSFTDSKLLPRLNFVGLEQYERLWVTPRWLVAIKNLAIYGTLSLTFSLVIGFLLAALMDQKIRFENTFRTIFLYPFALSFIVIPTMRPVFITTLVIVTSGIVRVYDLVVAQTSGGPGISSEVPAKYVYDYMFLAQNLGQGFAASTMMLITVIIVVVPWAYLQFGRTRRG